MTFNRILSICLSILFIATTNISSANAADKRYPDGYQYSYPSCDYKLKLPEPPTVGTVWRKSKENPKFLPPSPLDFSAWGEKAFYKRVEIGTLDYIDVKIYCLRAEQDYIIGLNQENMKGKLATMYKDLYLQDIASNFSAGTGSLKWSTISGYTINSEDKIIYHFGHFLSGTESVMFIQIEYTPDNPFFNDQYNLIDQSIMINQ